MKDLFDNLIVRSVVAFIKDTDTHFYHWLLCCYLIFTFLRISS